MTCMSLPWLLARVWDLATGDELARLEHGLLVASVAFSPDGTKLATGSLDSTARVWDVTSGEQLAYLPHDLPVNAVAFSPDGETLATASNDGVARLWDLTLFSKGDTLAFPHPDVVTAVAFSPDSSRLVTACQNGFVRVFLVRPEDLIAEACARLSRNFTHDEWERYFPDEPYRCTCENLPPCAE